MTRDDLRNEYFNWLLDLVCKQRYSSKISYKKLLMYLHNTDFRYLIQRDQNRAEDGIELRYRFALDVYSKDSVEPIMNCLNGPCSVLEMIVALAIHCEEDIMDDPSIGDRTGQWFWGMIVNLGLGSMIDSRFDKDYVEGVVTRFLDRKYDPDGKGGLFTVRNCDEDLRTVEIQYQLYRYLDNII